MTESKGLISFSADQTEIQTTPRASLGYNILYHFISRTVESICIVTGLVWNEVYTKDVILCRFQNKKKITKELTRL